MNWDNFKTYATSVYTIMFYIMLLWAGVEWILNITSFGNSGQFGSALLLWIFSSFIIPFRALLGTLVWGTVAVIVFYIPYLVYLFVFKGSK